MHQNFFIITLLKYSASLQSPIAHVHVAAGGNIIRKSFFMMAKCKGDGREPLQHMQRIVVAVLWC